MIIISFFRTDLHKHNLSRRVIDCYITNFKTFLRLFLGAFRKCAKRKVSSEIKQGLEFVFPHFYEVDENCKRTAIIANFGHGAFYLEAMKYQLL